MRKDVLVEVEKDEAGDEIYESATDTPRQYQHDFKCHRDLMMMSQKKNNFQNDDNGDLPHLVFFYPPIVNEGFLDPVKQQLTQFHDNNKRKQTQGFPRLVPLKHTWHFANEVYFQGSWKKLGKKKNKQQKWVGALMPIFGMSRKLAAAIVRDGLAGNSHVNQEVVLPLTAQLEKLKMITTYGCFPSQYYFSWMRRKETAPIYLEWASSYYLANNTRDDDEDLVDFRQGVRNAPQIGFDLYMRTKKITRNSAAFYGVLTKEFVGDDKIGHMLFHPVKL